MTILVVEDEPLVRQTVQRMLSARGYEVLDAESPEVALARAARRVAARSTCCSPTWACPG